MRKVWIHVSDFAGTIFISNFRTNCYQFHLSGRQRYEIVDNGKWQETPFIHLAFIGTSFDKEALQNHLQMMVSDSPQGSDSLPSAEIETEFEALLKTDKRFEYKCTIVDVVAFRLTGELTVVYASLIL